MRKWPKIALAFLAIGAVILLAALFLGSPAGSPPQPLPTPNGYDDFVSAGKLLDSRDVRDLSEDDLRAFVARNSNALQLAQVGLSRECRVPTPTSTKDLELHLPELSLFKGLASAMVGAGRLAEIEGRTNDAIRIYLDTVRLGHESVRGGILIDKLMGNAIESMGATALGRLARTLDAPACRHAIEALQKIEAASESTDSVLKREMDWVNRTSGGGLQRLRVFVMWHLLQQARSIRQSFIKRCQTQERSRRLLLTSLAVRAYELEQGRKPKALDDLVPSYLKAIPQDPFTGTNLVYAIP